MKAKVTNFVVGSLENIAVIGFLLFPILGLFAGGMGGGFVGALLGVFLGVVFGVMVFGALFLLMQNNQTLKEIRDLLKAKA